MSRNEDIGLAFGVGLILGAVITGMAGKVAVSEKAQESSQWRGLYHCSEFTHTGDYADECAEFLSQPRWCRVVREHAPEGITFTEPCDD